MSDGRPLQSTSAAATEALGRELAPRLAAGDVVRLEGDLAAGKTTLVRGLLAGLGGDPAEVTSPSFVLVETYPCRGRGIERLHHVDLYRLADRVGDLRELGLEELLSDPRAVVAMEWPKEGVMGWLPRDARVWRVALTVLDDDTREIEITEPD